MRKISFSLLTLITAYLLFWPVAIDPINWDAPVDKGYTGDFKQNTRLDKIDTIAMEYIHGPEGLALRNGKVYASTREGWIVRHNPKTGEIKKWVHTQGSPLGLAFDKQGNLLVADAYRGLLEVNSNGDITLLTAQINGHPIGYADDVDIADDGKIYFTDASTKFPASLSQDSYAASLLDIMEHGGHGRLLAYNPQDQSTKVIIDGLNFANGVAVAEDSSFVLVNETGAYRIHKIWLKGEKAGQSQIIIDNLPGFPDNITRGHDGRFWVGLYAPRSPALDALSEYPLIRKIVHRLPAILHPKPVPYSHVFAIDKQGKVLLSLQDPKGSYHSNTGALETKNWLYISSLHAKNLARISRADAGI